MARKITIIVDNGLRDLLPCRLLQEEFERRGVRVCLTDKRRMKIRLHAFNPDAVVIPRGDLPYLKDLSRCAHLYVVPCEGGRLTLKTMMSIFLGRVHKKDVMSEGPRVDQFSRVIENFDFLRRVYLWGEVAYRFLLESGYFKKGQLKITGCAKIEVYRNFPRREVNANDFVVGVAFSAKATSSYEGKINYAKVLFGFDEKAHLPMVPAGRHWEDYAWRDLAILRRMLNILKKFLDSSEGKVLIRVNPFENPADYEFLTELYPGRVEIQPYKGELFEFFESIDVLLTCWSTTGLEAILCDVPVIAIPDIIDRQHLLSHVDPEANGFDTYLPCYHLPKTEEEALDLIEQARMGQLELSPNMGHYNRLMKDVYHWPSKESPVEEIVSDILEDLSGIPAAAAGDLSGVMGLARPVELFVKYMVILPRAWRFRVVELAYQTKFFVEDVLRNRLKGSSRHHMVKSDSVERVIKEYRKNLKRQGLIKEVPHEEKTREAVH